MDRTFDIKHYRGFFGITCLCLVILYGPLIIVMIYSFNDSVSITNWGGLSLRWYVEIFTGLESAKFKAAAWNSFSIAIMGGNSLNCYCNCSRHRYDPWWEFQR